MTDAARRIAVLEPDHGSFRDRANRVYQHGDRVIRGVSSDVLGHWKAISKESFYRSLMAERKIVFTELVESASVPQEGRKEWAAFLSHERIPFISYPYEWPFGMLKDAALLHLEILERAIPSGWALKDATAYNIQWVGSRPVFIDVPSFEPYTQGTAWAGYRQFCMMFLYPLMLRAYKGIDYLPWLRGNLEGIDPITANQILSGVAKFRKGVLGHVYLHSKMQQRHAARDLMEAKALTETADRRPAEQKAIRHSEAMVLGTIQNVRRTIEKLQTPDSRTTWGNYDTDHSYAEASFAAKKAFVEACIQSKRRKLIWDIGCNTGTFSRIATENSDYVLAVDGDVKAIERLYQMQKLSSVENILSLVMDLSNVSPDQGWRGRERKALEKRGLPDLVLCLALIHHIVISANIPVDEFLGWLRDLNAEVVLEWVGRDDDMTRMLLRNRVDQYSELSEESFEQSVKLRFTIKRVEALKGGVRKIYHLAPI